MVGANCRSGFSKGHGLISNSFQVSSCCGRSEDAEHEWGMLTFPCSGEHNPSLGKAGAMQRHRLEIISLQAVSTSSSSTGKKPYAEGLMRRCYC